MGIALSNLFSTTFYLQWYTMEKHTISSYVIPLCMGVHIGSGQRETVQAAITESQN